MTWWLLQNAVATAVLALVVAAFCRATRVGPVVRHALWLIVLVKLVTPPLVIWPWGLPDPLGLAASGRSDDASTVHVPVRGSVAAGSVEEAPRSVDPAVAPDGWALTAGVTGETVARIWPRLAGIWIAGSLVLALVEATRLTRLARRVRRAEPAGAALKRRVAALAARMGLGPVDVRVLAGHEPPSVWCGGRPRVLLPAGLVAEGSDLCLDGLLVHELAHIKRRDHLVAWLELVAGIIWWWYPLFWFVRASLRNEAELACDAWVVSTLPNGRRAYAESLLAVSGADVRGPMPMAAVGVRASSRRVLERRLVMIMQGRTPLRMTRVGAFVLAIVAAATLPAWAASQDPPPPPTPVVSPARVPPLPPPPAPAPVAERVDVSVVPQTPPPSTPAPVAVPLQTPIPPPPPSVLVRPQTPPPPPPARPRREDVRVVAPTPTPRLAVRVDRRVQLPVEGAALLEVFTADRDAIEREAAEKVEARRLELVKALENLQQEYATAGKLDEAVAIRDFLRAGLPGPTPKAVKTPTAIKR